MKNEDLKNIFVIIIIILLFVVGIKFLTFLAPLILLVLVGYLIYRLYVRTRDETIEKVNIHVNSNKSSKKKTRVHEAEVVREKNED